MSYCPTPLHEIVAINSGDAHWEHLRQQCFDVRIDVFHHEQKFPLEAELDDQEDTATHFLLRLLPSLTPVGTIRLVRRKSYYKLTRLAVLKDYRKFKFGRDLVLALHDYVKKEAFEAAHRPDTTSSAIIPEYVKVHSHSQLYVKGFYAKFGYEPEGEEFDEDGEPHQLMVAKLKIQRSCP
ncbi:acyl-CoA N-acyltransferase [Abortiporus biennis]|nr:acyl-CoA N-acyltransferase [Abortiporus biennis]